MKCMEARHMVTPFVKGELSEKDTEAFLNHVGTCADCMDELDSYYIAYHASDLLDSGEKQEYDFEKMLREEIRAARRSIARKKFVSRLRVFLLVLVALLLLLRIFFSVNFEEEGTKSGIFRRIFPRVQAEASPDGHGAQLSAADFTEKEESNYETENCTD